MPSATPNAQAASTLPPTYLILVFNACPRLLTPSSPAKLRRQGRKTSHHILANQLFRLCDSSLLRNLDLQFTSSETEVQNFGDAGFFAFRESCVVFADLVTSRNTEIDASFTHEGWDVGCRQEDECDGEVFDEGDVKAGFAAELDVGAGEEVQGCLLEAALYRTSNVG